MSTALEFLALFAIVAGLFFVFRFLGARNPDSPAYKTALGLGLGTGFILLWVSLGVGIFGHPDPLEVAALPVGGIGAIIARFQPRGMARALLATALTQGLVGVLALITGSASQEFWPREMILNGFLVAMFVGSALLFRKAARELAT